MPYQLRARVTTRPVNERGREVSSYGRIPPPPGYSINQRHWDRSKLYEKCVEKFCKRSYLDFCKDYYLNANIVLRYCRGDDSVTEDRIVTADYRDYLFKLIIHKAHCLFWGESSREDFMDQEYYDIDEHTAETPDRVD